MVNEKNIYVTIIGLFDLTDCNDTGGFHWVSCPAFEVSFGVPVTGTFIL